MLALLRTGHWASCPAQDGLSCRGRCEPVRYLVTGVLAITAGLLEGGIAWNRTLTVLLDGVHALADGLGDFISAAIARFIHGKEKPVEERWRLIGNRCVAFLIGGSSVFIAVEAMARFANPPSVDTLVMVVAPAVVALIHIVRISLLHASPFQNITRTGLLAHAIGDLAASVIAVLAGTIAIFSPVDAPLVDLGFSIILAGWLLWISWKLWRGHGHHH